MTPFVIREPDIWRHSGIPSWHWVTHPFFVMCKNSSKTSLGHTTSVLDSARPSRQGKCEGQTLRATSWDHAWRKMLIGIQAKAVTTSHTVTTAFLSISTGQWKCLGLPAAFYSSHTRSASVFFQTIHPHYMFLLQNLQVPSGVPRWGS